MNYVVRPATRDELEIMIDWAAKEGWNPGLYDADAFRSIDSRGFLLGFLDNQPVTSISAVSYNNKFGFIGFYIAKPEYRGKGYGYQIWNEAMKYLSSKNVALDGVVTQQENYKKSGFKFAYRHIRYEGKGSDEKTKDNKYVIPLSKINLDLLHKYDKKIFLHDRKNFLKLWIAQPESLSIGYVKNKKLLGYGMVRKCRSGFKVGPLFADSKEIAKKLFERMRSYIGKNNLIYLDVPEPNKEAVSLSKEFNMKPMFETARMYTKEIPKTPLNKVFGVTTFEIG
ncbi:GNAT family N-acetyltransferase [Candidatus Roizmanbacteria bacterium]|nr:GNAT family N-acetyltransferase [Candidatus Roizmanbacteria bacterium]